MRLVRYGERGAEKPGILGPDGRIHDLSAVVKDIAGDVLGPEGLKHLKGLDLGSLPAVKGRPRLGAPIASVPKFLGIGLNYRDHAEETGMPIPEAPIIFAKATSCIAGPNDPILMPKGWERMDFEVELAFAIGSVAKNVVEADALYYVAGYMIADDVSERSLQKGGPGEWIKAKSHDSFGPLGPWLVTKDEVPDPQKLGLTLDLNGARMQTGNTSTMIFSVARLVSYISRFMTLMPGDVVTTGTPPGVGMARNPRVFLKEGDELALTVEGLGEQQHRLVREA
jgi:2-keto-4-pentenoate hydratase/2-oxohepta-3-ene-1,7-dioic acid hydratase in catechol pathway